MSVSIGWTRRTLTALDTALTAANFASRAVSREFAMYLEFSLWISLYVRTFCDFKRLQPEEHPELRKLPIKPPNNRLVWLRCWIYERESKISRYFQQFVPNFCQSYDVFVLLYLIRRYPISFIFWRKTWIPFTFLQFPQLLSSRIGASNSFSIARVPFFLYSATWRLVFGVWTLVSKFVGIEWLDFHDSQL